MDKSSRFTHEKFEDDVKFRKYKFYYFQFTVVRKILCSFLMDKSSRFTQEKFEDDVKFRNFIW
jgi:hypothetical protein